MQGLGCRSACRHRKRPRSTSSAEVHASLRIGRRRHINWARETCREWTQRWRGSAAQQVQKTPPSRALSRNQRPRALHRRLTRALSRRRSSHQQPHKCRGALASSSLAQDMGHPHGTRIGGQTSGGAAARMHGGTIGAGRQIGLRDGGDGCHENGSDPSWLELG